MFYITLTIEEDGGEESPLNIHTVDSDIESSTYSQVSIYIYIYTVDSDIESSTYSQVRLVYIYIYIYS